MSLWANSLNQMEWVDQFSGWIHQDLEKETLQMMIIITLNFMYVYYIIYILLLYIILYHHVCQSKLMISVVFNILKLTNDDDDYD